MNLNLPQFDNKFHVYYKILVICLFLSFVGLGIIYNYSKNFSLVSYIYLLLFANLFFLSAILNIEIIKLINFKNSNAKLLVPILTFLLSVFSYRLVMIWVNQVSRVEPSIFQGTIIVTTILASFANYFSIFILFLIYFMVKYMLPSKKSELVSFSTVGRMFGCILPIASFFLFYLAGGYIFKPIIMFSIVNLDMREYAYECTNSFPFEKVRILGDNKILVYTPNVQDSFRVDVCK